MKSTYIRVATLDEVSDEKPKLVELGEAKIALFLVDGQVYAISNTCSHSGGPLSEGQIDGTTVACPWHGAKFDITTGRNLTLPAVVPVQKYSVEVRDDGIYVSP